ncbi:MAG: LysM peptidoglycan-binding domain-containing protein [Acidimicrobiales bacterium]
MTRTMIRIRTIGALLVLFAVIAMLHFARSFGLEGPSGFSFDALNRWASDPVMVMATVVRWLALALSYYLVIVVALVGFSGPEQSPSSRLVPPGVATMVAVLLGIAASSMASKGDSSAIVAGTSAIEQPLTIAPADEPLTIELLDDVGAPRPDIPARHPLAAPSSSSRPAPETTRPVMPGDHFWSIAEETLETSWGRGDLTDREIAGYWQTLIDANLDQLVEPDNPDLLLPGQVLTLPDTPKDSRG